MTEENCAEDGSDVVDDGNVRHGRRRKAVDCLQEVWIQVLGSVREKHEKGHHHDQERECLPLGNSCCHDFAEAGRSMLMPCLRFANFQADVKSEKCRYATSPKHCSPTPDWENDSSSNRR